MALIINSKPIKQFLVHYNSGEKYFFVDNGVKCPDSENPYQSQFGNVSTKLICRKCVSCKEILPQGVICDGKAAIIRSEGDIINFLSPEEIVEDLFIETD